MEKKSNNKLEEDFYVLINNLKNAKELMKSANSIISNADNELPLYEKENLHSQHSDEIFEHLSEIKRLVENIESDMNSWKRSNCYEEYWESSGCSF